MARDTLSSGSGGRRQERLALDTYIRLNRTANAVTARVLEYAPLPAALTLPQFGVLEALLHLGPMCQADLGRKLLRTRGNISLVVDNLAGRGLVTRRRSHRDRRQMEVSLTTEGRQLIAGYFPEHARGIDRAMAALAPEEQEALAALCRRLETSENSVPNTISREEAQ